MSVADLARALALFESERARFARELHGDAAQTMAYLTLQIETSVQDQTVREQLQRTASAAIQSIRTVMTALAPPPLRQGWEPEFRRLISGALNGQMDAAVTIRGLPEVPAALCLITYRFLEAVLRCFRPHAQENKLKIRLTHDDKWFRLSLTTNLTVLPHWEEQIGIWSELLEHAGGLIRVRTGSFGSLGITLRLAL